jgi:hypothetical protein
MYLMRIFPLADDAMPHDENRLTPAEPHDLAEAVALLCGSSKDASAPATLTPSGPFFAAERIVRHLDRAGFVVMNFQSTTFGAGRDCEGSPRGY